MTVMKWEILCLSYGTKLQFVCSLLRHEGHIYRDGPDGGIVPQLTLSLQLMVSQEAEVVPLKGPALLMLTH